MSHATLVPLYHFAHLRRRTAFVNEKKEARMEDRFPHLNMCKDGFVFIITYGRSGSTLLQHILNSIPGYCIRGENHNMLPHLAMSWKAAILAVENQPGPEDWEDSTHPWYGIEKLNPEIYGKTLANVFVRDVLAPPPGTRVCGFKEIRFHATPALFWQSMEFLTQFFPKSRLIFNTRNHQDVSRSGWWKTWEPEKVFEELVMAEDLFTKCQQRYPKRSFALKFEDYRGRPEAFAPLFDFLGESFDLETVARISDKKLTHLK